MLKYAMAADEIIAFGTFELDLPRGELRREGAVVPTEPQVLDLIAHLARHKGQIVSRDDLIEHVWGGRIVSDSAIASRINAARAALGDDGSAQKIIKTIPRRGFRFEAEIGGPAPNVPALPDKPSVAVLPFENMSGDPEQSYFSDGITDDIITDLSRYDELFVIARHSSFAYRHSTLPTAEIARELGVRYIAEGSVRRAGNRIRVTAELIDPRAGQQLWAERYDRELTDIFEVQDEIASVIVSTLAGQIARQHYLRVVAKSEDSVIAYDHILKGMEHGLRVTPQDCRIAREEALKALEIDPNVPRAHGILAFAMATEGNNFWVEDSAEAFRYAYEEARAAVAADPRDPWAHATHGLSDLWCNRAHTRAEAAMRQAVALNPSNALIRGLYGYLLAYTGKPDVALQELDISARLNPHFPPMFNGFRGRALLLQRKVKEALPYLELMASQMPAHCNGLAYLAAAYVHLDRLDDARAAVEQLRAQNTYYRLGALRRFSPFIHAADLAYVVDALEQSGLPE